MTGADLITVLVVIAATEALPVYAWLRERSAHKRTRDALKWVRLNSIIKSDVWEQFK